MSELPPGWTTAAIGKLGEWRGGGTPAKSNPAFWTNGTIPWVSAKDMKRDFIADAEDYITAEAVGGSATQTVAPNSVLVVTRSGILRHSLPVATNTVAVAINQDLKALTPNYGVDAQFVMRQLQADAQAILADCVKTGTTVESLDFKKFTARTFRVAPRDEQLRIVTQVNGLLARTARARAELSRIPALIARYRERIIELALNGELTVDWRSKHGSRDWIEQALHELVGQRTGYETSRRASRLRTSPNIVVGDARGLPSSWLACNMSDVVELRVGYAFKSQWFAPDGPRLLRGANVAPGRIDWSDERRLSPKYEAAYEHYRLEAGDVVLAMDRPLISTGLKIALVTDQDAGALLVQRVANPRPSNWLNPKYLYYLFHGRGFIAQIEKHATGSDLPHISSHDILTTPVPLPPLAEQAEIVRRIEMAFNRIELVAADQAAAARLIPNLDAAILDKAFRGKLVPQDPADEPASVLLERSHAERGAVTGKLRRGRRVPPAAQAGSDTTAADAAPPITAVSRIMPRRPAMPKSRLDPDVMGRPYLADKLKALDSGDVRDLFSTADLPVADFYKQLAWEISAGHIRDSATVLEAA